MIRLCFHRWSDWSAPYVDQFASEGRLLQARKCVHCGKVGIGRVRQPFYSRSALKDLLSRLGLVEAA